MCQLSGTRTLDVIKLILLTENPFHPLLLTKRIKSTTDLFKCSVNMNIRIIWYYEGNKMIILVDVGHHDILPITKDRIN